MQESFLFCRTLTYLTTKNHTNSKLPSVDYFIIKYLKSLLTLFISCPIIINLLRRDTQQVLNQV